MRVELVGLPGVGKTSLIEENLGFIESQYEVVRSNKQNLIEKFATKALYLNKFRPMVQDEQLAKKLAYRSSFRIFLNKRSHCFFHDSGLLQVIVEFLIEMHNPDFDMCEELIEKIDLPDRLLFLKDNLVDTVNRELQRTPRRFDICEQDLLKKYCLGQKFIEKCLLSKVDNHKIIAVGKTTKSQLRQIFAPQIVIEN